MYLKTQDLLLRVGKNERDLEVVMYLLRAFVYTDTLLVHTCACARACYIRTVEDMCDTCVCHVLHSPYV